MNDEAATRYSSAFSIGGRIRRARLEQGMALSGFALAVGVAKVSAWKWENGQIQPRDSNLDRIAEVLNIPVGDLRRSRAVASVDVRNLIDDCRQRIGDALGLAPDNVAIIVTFGGVAET